MKHNYTDKEISAAIDEACANSATGLLLAMAPAVEKWDNQAPARLALAKGLLARLPEPPPPVVDGKTPAETAVAGFIAGGQEYFPWSTLPEPVKECWRSSSSAVLAAFGNKPASQPTGQHGPAGMPPLRGPGLILEPVEQPAEIPWTPWPGGVCPLKMEHVWTWECKMRDGRINASITTNPENWRWKHFDNFSDITAYRVTKWRDGHESAAVDWKARHDELQKDYADHAAAMELLHAQAEKAEAELAALQGRHDRLIQKHDLLKCDTDKQLQLSTLRPISEAGDVPAGCVRVYYEIRHGKVMGVSLERFGSLLNHFADIRLPADGQAPAAEAAKPEPETFTAHGKPWIKHTPGDTMQIYPHIEDGQVIDLVKKSEHDAVVRELNERLFDFTQSHLHAEARNVQTIQRQAVELSKWQALAEMLATHLHLVTKEVPCMEGGECFFPQHSPDGDYVGEYQVHPHSVIQAMDGHARQALAAYDAAKVGNLPDPLDEAVKRMEAVAPDELITAYCDGPGTGGIGAACCRVRARLIQAAKGGQP